MNKNHSKKKRNYPKTRKKRVLSKPRDTDYSETQKVIKKVGSDTIKEILLTNGIYTGAKILSSLYGKYVHWTTTGYLRKKFGWVRLVTSRDETLAKSVLNGTVPLNHYKYIKFSEEIKNEVLQKYSR